MKKGMPGILAILSEGGKSEEKSSKESTKSDLKVYAQDLLDAIASQDAESVATAFADMADCYQENGYDIEEEEDDDEESI